MSQTCKPRLHFCQRGTKLILANSVCLALAMAGPQCVWVGAIDPRVKCVISVVGIGNGARWMRSVRRPDEYHDLLQRSATDRINRMHTGK